jgi:hypothetical protein
MREIRFTFLCNEIERSLLSAIARRLRRSQGDAIRLLLYRAADDLGISSENQETGAAESSRGGKNSTFS